MSLQLQYYPNEILTTRCTNLDFPTIEEALEAREIMLSHNGIGIAAPQVGLDKRFFWAKDRLCINPTITATGTHQLSTVEGCLSLPNKQYVMTRSFAVTITYYSYLGKYSRLRSGASFGLITEKLYGIDAVVAQHEYDHLEGLLINRLSDET